MQHSSPLTAGDIVKHTLLFVIGSALSVSAFAQAGPQESIAPVPAGSVPTYVVSETSRTVEAVDYQHRSGASEVDLAGTALLPSADGKAKVRSKRGTMEVEADFGNLQSPTTFGAEYLTYVMWAISPDGHAVNLGEVLIGGNDRSKLTATTNLQAFALIVTAEPYFAVRQPSNVVVLENVIRADTRGTPEAMHAKYELMERGGYIPTGYRFDPVVLDAKLPLEFLEARNAVRIAQSEGAETYAGESYQHAVQLMNSADTYATEGHSDRKQLIAKSRETVQTAEDAREIAVKRIEDNRRASELQAAADAQALLQARADEATRQKLQAEADARRAEADTANAEAVTTRTQADMMNNQAASTEAINTAQADADRYRLIAQHAQEKEQQADSEKMAMRTQLEARLNEILETRDSARGLIVSMSDVLFDTGQYSLKPGAREKLAKVAGILIAYPSLNIAVGGYTDNVGGDEMNQKLSENRAGAVREYLVQQGVVATSVSATGFGNSSPVATNDNSAGRQENRRVELVVSGEAIGSPVNPTTGSLR
jgi:outer membrane protein OmpA-like peptidoglycan-associated protein